MILNNDPDVKKVQIVDRNEGIMCHNKTGIWFYLIAYGM